MPAPAPQAGTPDPGQQRHQTGKVVFVVQKVRQEECFSNSFPVVNDRRGKSLSPHVEVGNGAAERIGIGGHDPATGLDHGSREQARTASQINAVAIQYEFRKFGQQTAEKKSRRPQQTPERRRLHHLPSHIVVQRLGRGIRVQEKPLKGGARNSLPLQEGRGNKVC